jgi:hypothetical protein
MAIFILLSAFMGALGRRVAGGAFEQWTGKDIGDYPVRAFFGLMLALAAFMGSGWNPVAFLLIPSTFFGCSIPNFGSIAMGRGASAGGTSWKHDAIGLTGHGVLSMAITASPLVFFNSDWTLLILAGFLIVPAYELGWSITGIEGKKEWPISIRGGSELGECAWGAACGLAAYGVLQ